MKRRDFIAALGGAAAMPLPGIAQQPKPVIGFLSGVWPNAVTEFTGIFQQTLRQAGYAIGQNVDIEYRWAGANLTVCPQWLLTWFAVKSALSLQSVATNRLSRPRPQQLPYRSCSRSVPIR